MKPSSAFGPVIFFVSLLLFCVNVSCPAIDREAVDELTSRYEEAVKIYEAGDFENAKEALTKVMQDAHQHLHADPESEDEMQAIRLGSIRCFAAIAREEDDFEKSEKWINVGIILTTNQIHNVATAKQWSATFLQERMLNNEIQERLKAEEEWRDRAKKRFFIIMSIVSTFLLLLLTIIFILRTKLKFTFSFLAKEDKRRAFEILSPSEQNTLSGPADPLQAKLEHFIKDEKAYLNKDLCIEDLCHELGTNRTYVSKVFSEKSTSFNAYVNHLRVAEAIRLMTVNPEMSMEEVWTGSGFKAQTTFYSWFKELTGLTPSQFKKSNI